MPVLPHDSHDVTALANINITGTLRVKVKPNQVNPRIHGSQGVCYSFDSADFDFGHSCSVGHVKNVTFLEVNFSLPRQGATRQA
jgi:hypothetical protein